MWGHKRKVGGTSKIFRPALCAGIVPPHLQIASDATKPLKTRNQKKNNFLFKKPMVFNVRQSYCARY